VFRGPWPAEQNEQLQLLYLIESLSFSLLHWV